MIPKIALLNLLLVSIFLIKMTNSTYPIAIFHGIAQNCQVYQMRNLVNKLKLFLHTDKVKCIQVGSGFFSSFLGSFTSQSEEACKLIRNEEMFASDFSVVGVSQGGLLARYILEKCEMKGTVRKYISISSPQMGVTSVPKLLNCGFLCESINFLFAKIIYTSFAQNYIGPAGYARYRYDLNSYKEHSNFLADLNNERDVKNPKYKERVLKLEKMVLVMNDKDTIVTPKTSAWFESYDELGNNIVRLKDSKFYKEDFIGLRQLNKEKKLIFLRLKGRHITFDDKDILKKIAPILK